MIHSTPNAPTPAIRPEATMTHSGLPVPSFGIPHLRVVCAGRGQVSETGDGLRMTIPATPAGRYADAQVDDHGGVKRSRLPWRPPLRLSLRARASHPAPAGTLGFGLWNDPFAFSGGMATGKGLQLPAAPSCAWFFYGSPPNDFSLFTGDPAPGWKAMTFHAASTFPYGVVGGLSASSLPLARWLGLARPALALARRWVRTSQRDLGDPSVWHDYALEWRSDGVKFWVDGVLVHETPVSPAGPLGFIAWIDNQYAVASASGHFAFGVLPVSEAQHLEVSGLRLE